MDDDDGIDIDLFGLRSLPLLIDWDLCPASEVRDPYFPLGDQMTASEVYNGSNGSETRRLMTALRRRGRIGEIAALLFTAQKASERAKRYGYSGFQSPRGRVTYRDLSYSRKGEALFSLCEALKELQPEAFLWGWKKDGDGFGMPPWVMYVDLPTGQVSFHSQERYPGPEYPKEWDRVRKASPARVVQFCQNILDGNFIAL